MRYPCDKCDFRATNSHKLKLHIARKHVGYSCSKCDYTSDSLKNVNMHIQSKHERARYPCKQCDHVKSKHIEVRYPCNICDCTASTASNLKQHIKIKHKGMQRFYSNSNQSTFHIRVN